MFEWITELDEYIKKTEKSKLTAGQIADHFGIPLQILCQQVLYIYHRTVRDHVLYLKGEKEPVYPFLYTPMERWMYGNDIPETKDKTRILPLEAYHGRFTEFAGSLVAGYKVPYSELLTMKPEDYPKVSPETWEGGPLKRWEGFDTAPYSRFQTLTFCSSRPVVYTYKEIGAIGEWVDPDEETGEMSYFFGHTKYIFSREREEHLERTEIEFPDGMCDIFKNSIITDEAPGFHPGDLNDYYTGPIIRRSGCYRMLSGEEFVPYDYSRPCFEGCYGDGKICLFMPFVDESLGWGESDL